MREAIELYKKDGSAAGIFYCSECRVVFKTKEEAGNCHGERHCECGKLIDDKFRSSCPECTSKVWAERETAKEMERFENAHKLSASEYEGDMVYVGEKFYESVEDAIDQYLEGQEPEYVWACRNVGVPIASSDGIVESLVENMWEDADSSDLNGLDELDEAIGKFNEANKSIRVFHPDYTTAILLAHPSMAAIDTGKGTNGK